MIRAGEPAPVHGGNLRWAAERFGVPPERIADFSANVNPLGPPPAAVAAVAAALGRLREYPDPECRAATEAVAAYLQVPAENVLLTNGGAEAIDLAARWLGPRRVAVGVPAFGEYAESIGRAGGSVIPCPAAPGTRAARIAEWAAASAEVGAGLICNPNNPTGELVPATALLPIARELAKGGTRLVVDEAFIDFLPRPERESLRFEACRRADLVVLGSLTKFFALPGVRIGYLVTAAGTLRALRALQPAWSVNALAQAAAVAAVGDQTYQARTRRLIARERDRLGAALRTIPGLRPYDSAVNFLLVDCRGTGCPAAWWRDQLGRQGVLVRACDHFDGLDAFHLRVAVRTPRERARLVAALRCAGGAPGAFRQRPGNFVAGEEEIGAGRRSIGTN